MEIYYSDQALPDDFSQSIFLAGPTPRTAAVNSWRPEALQILSELQFTGKVLVPEWSTGQFRGNYIEQVEWEERGLDGVTAIAFWVPRVMETMPGLTTNVEFGRYVSICPDRVFYGRPDWAVSTRYLDWLYERHAKRKPFDRLSELLASVVIPISNKVAP